MTRSKTVALCLLLPTLALTAFAGVALAQPLVAPSPTPAPTEPVEAEPSAESEAAEAAEAGSEQNLVSEPGGPQQPSSEAAEEAEAEKALGEEEPQPTQPKPRPGGPLAPGKSQGSNVYGLRLLSPSPRALAGAAGVAEHKLVVGFDLRAPARVGLSLYRSRGGHLHGLGSAVRVKGHRGRNRVRLRGLTRLRRGTYSLRLTVNGRRVAGLVLRVG